jgi:hypothetical protein
MPNTVSSNSVVAPLTQFSDGVPFETPVATQAGRSGAQNGAGGTREPLRPRSSVVDERPSTRPRHGSPSVTPPPNSGVPSLRSDRHRTSAELNSQPQHQSGVPTDLAKIPALTPSFGMPSDLPLDPNFFAEMEDEDLFPPGTTAAALQHLHMFGAGASPDVVSSASAANYDVRLTHLAVDLPEVPSDPPVATQAGPSGALYGASGTRERLRPGSPDVDERPSKRPRHGNPSTTPPPNSGVPSLRADRHRTPADLNSQLPHQSGVPTGLPTIPALTPSFGTPSDLPLDPNLFAEMNDEDLTALALSPFDELLLANPNAGNADFIAAHIKLQSGSLRSKMEESNHLKSFDKWQNQDLRFRPNLVDLAKELRDKGEISKNSDLLQFYSECYPRATKEGARRLCAAMQRMVKGKGACDRLRATREADIFIELVQPCGPGATAIRVFDNWLHSQQPPLGFVSVVCAALSLSGGVDDSTEIKSFRRLHRSHGSRVKSVLELPSAKAASNSLALRLSVVLEHARSEATPVDKQCVDLAYRGLRVQPNEHADPIIRTIMALLSPFALAGADLAASAVDWMNNIAMKDDTFARSLSRAGLVGQPRLLLSLARRLNHQDVYILQVDATGHPELLQVREEPEETLDAVVRDPGSLPKTALVLLQRNNCFSALAPIDDAADLPTALRGWRWNLEKMSDDSYIRLIQAMPDRMQELFGLADYSNWRLGDLSRPAIREVLDRNLAGESIKSILYMDSFQNLNIRRRSPMVTALASLQYEQLNGMDDQALVDWMRGFRPNLVRICIDFSSWLRSRRMGGVDQPTLTELMNSPEIAYADIGDIVEQFVSWSSQIEKPKWLFNHLFSLNVRDAWQRFRHAEVSHVP